MQQTIYMVRFLSIPDPVSIALGEAAAAWQVPPRTALLREDSSLTSCLSALREAGQGGAGFVGVGLAGTLLLGLAALCGPQSDVRVLALFPYLGADAAVYGASSAATNWGNRWLRLARIPLIRHVMAYVAVSPPPLGLVGIYAPGRMSWAHAAAAIAKVDFVNLIVPVSCPTTVVLNRDAEHLDAELAGVVVPALNDTVQLAFSQPGADNLALRVQAWSQGGRFDDTEVAPHG